MSDHDDALASLAGSGARRTGRSVQQLVKWAANPTCGTSSAMFAARVDSDHLVRGSRWAQEYGQSPAAMRRGARVERIARDDNYKVTAQLAREHLGFSDDDVTAVSLRTGFSPNRVGMIARAAATRALLDDMLAGGVAAPNLIEGAVLELSVSGETYQLEADTLGIRQGGALHILEFKGWALVDGRFDDPSKTHTAAMQMGVYGELARTLVTDLGHDPGTVVSRDGMLITPRNTSMTLTGTRVDLGRPIRQAQTMLTQVPPPSQFVGAVDTSAHNFGFVADTGRDDDSRGEAAAHLLDVFGHRYTSACASTCGLWKLCRERAHAAGDVDLAGEVTAQAVPGVGDFSRVIQLASGGSPAAGEEAVAEQLAAVAGLAEADGDDQVAA